jgi:hypothetical protein
MMNSNEQSGRQLPEDQYGRQLSTDQPSASLRTLPPDIALVERICLVLDRCVPGSLRAAFRSTGKSVTVRFKVPTEPIKDAESLARGLTRRLNWACKKLRTVTVAPHINPAFFDVCVRAEVVPVPSTNVDGPSVPPKNVGGPSASMKRLWIGSQNYRWN